MSDEPKANEINIDVTKICEQMKIRPTIYVKLVTSFTESLEHKFNVFQQALEQNNREQMRMIMHEIKGTASNLRLNNIIGPQAVLHTAVKAGEKKEALSRHFEILKDEADRLRAYVVHMNHENNDT